MEHFLGVFPRALTFFRLEVKDNGIGIRKEDIPKLFTEFQQLDSSLDKKYEGTGLGLALTKRIAEAIGGKVGVKSIVNKGSTFSTVLPRTPLDVDKKVPLALKKSILKEMSTSQTIDIAIKGKAISGKSSAKWLVISPTVLVIEDDAKDNALITKTLINAGYSVEFVFTGAEAIRLLQEKRFDVITLDLLLPDMNGWDVLRAVRSKGPNLETPAIVVTIVGTKVESFGHMVQSFLTKPITSDVLITALQQTGIYPKQNKSILFVDDDPHMLTSFKDYLKRYDSTVLCESDPEEALIIANMKHPDVIVLDLLMPGMDVLEYLRRFRLTDFGKKTPVIICTSQDIGEVDRKRIKASVAAIVQKGDGSMKHLISEMKLICPIDKYQIKGAK